MTSMDFILLDLLQTVINLIISEALDSVHEAKTIAIDFIKAFDKVWHMGLFVKVSNYDYTGKVFEMLKPFLNL